MNAKAKVKRVEPGKSYKISFGVKQTEQINKAANSVNETPETFVKTATTEHAKTLTGQ